jgi:hypothetical protein
VFDNQLDAFRRQFRKWGKDLMGVTWGTCATVSAAGVAAGSFLSGVVSALSKILIDFRDFYQFGWFLFVYGLVGVLVICALMVMLKFGAHVFGSIFVRIGGPDRIDIQDIGSGTRITEIQISNNETEDFRGQLKVTRIGSVTFRVPRTLGIFRGEELEKDILLIPGDNVSLAFVVLNTNDGHAFITDFYHHTDTLRPDVTVQTKLIGKLGDRENIIKTSSWFVDSSRNEQKLYIRRL